MPNLIYLIGMMGSGKSVTGKALAQCLGYEFADLDQVITAKAGKSIPEIFSSEGEAAFRVLESQALREVSAGSRKVIATGGGVVLKAENTERMRETGTVIYLETSFPVLWERVKLCKNRPLLQGGNPEESLKTIYQNRKTIYEQSADQSVSTDGETGESAAQKILNLLRG